MSRIYVTCIRCMLFYVFFVVYVGTFAIQNVSVSSGAPGELRVTASFLTNTSAVGVLAIVYSTDNDLDIHYTEARLPQTEIHLTDLSGSAYSTSVFGIEDSGLPFNKAATLPMSINITQGTHVQDKVCHVGEGSSVCSMASPCFIACTSTVRLWGQRIGVVHGALVWYGYCGVNEFEVLH